MQEIYFWQFYSIIVLSWPVIIIYIYKDTKKRGMSQVFALIGVFSLIGLIIYFFVRSPLTIISNNHQSNVKNFSSSSTEFKHTNILIPDSCPFCKSPNVNKLRLCEWCGNQIV